MATDYTIQQGDHLTRIAGEHGFRTLLPIWNHPRNEALRALRASPHVLLPGDVLHIPDLTEKTVSRATGATHVFRARGQRLRVRLKALDHRFRAIGDLRCQLDISGPGDAPATDGEGVVQKMVPANAESGLLRVGEDVMPLRVGHLDPVDAPTGAQARLNALGYDAGESNDPADPQFRSAIEELQCDAGLQVSGLLDADTLSKLLSLHGC